MGSQLAKHSRESPSNLKHRTSVDSECDKTPDYISSALNQPINTSVGPSQPQSQSRVSHRLTSQSHSSATTATNSHTNTIPSQITIVNEANSSDSDNNIFTLPPLFKPIVPIGHELSAHNPVINCNHIINIGLLIEEDFRNKAEFVAKEQNRLTERIKDIDLIVGHVNTIFVNERQRSLTKSGENFNKIHEINSLIEKCENDISKCARSLELLNRHLPQNLSLEKFEFTKNKNK